MDVSETAFAPLLRDAIPALCRRFHVRSLDLFGSAATGRFDPDHSDLDFLVSFEAAPEGGSFDAYFGFRDALMALSGRSVDLVMVSALENPYFRRQVDRERMRVFSSG